MKSIVGKVLRDRYRIVREISQEEFSAVYLAEDRNNPGNSGCEIERLQPDQDSAVLGSKSWQKVRELFNFETDALQKLNQHPQIPQLLAYFEENREFYLIREFINGESLASRLQAGLLEEAEAIFWLEETLKILDFVHQQSILHLKIRPSSLIQQYQDKVIYLTEFGTLKNSLLSVNNRSSISKDINISDSGFIPIEQQQGKPNFTSDLYALGKTIIYALTGDTADLINLDIETEQTSTTQNRNHPEIIISSRLIAVLSKMTSEQSSDRYQSAAEILAELDKQQKVITLPPPFVINNYLPQTQITNKDAAAIKSKSKFTQNILWLLLILPFIAALITLVFGISKRTYKNFAIYTNENYDFSIKYPKNWSSKELEDPITGEVVVFSSPRESSSDFFLENVSISVEYLISPKTTLDEYTTLVFDKIKQNKNNQIEVYEEKQAKIDGHPARKVVYSRQESGLLLRQMETFTIRDDRVYIIIYTAERAKFSKFLGDAQKIVKSWEIQTE